MADPAAGLSLEELQGKYRTLVKKHADVSAKAKGRLVELSSALKGTREEKDSLESQLQAATAKLAQFKTLTVKKVQGLQQKITELEQHKTKEPSAETAASSEGDEASPVVAELNGKISELQAALEAKTEEAERYATSDRKMRDTLSVLRAKTKERVESMKQDHAKALAEATQRFETELKEKVEALEVMHAESVAAAVAAAEQTSRAQAEETFAEKLKNTESEVQELQQQLDAAQQQNQTARARELVAAEEAQSTEAELAEEAASALRQEHAESIAALRQEFEERVSAEGSLEQQALRQAQETAAGQLEALKAQYAEEMRELTRQAETQATESAAREGTLKTELETLEQQSQARLGELVKTVESQQEATQTFMVRAVRVRGEGRGAGGVGWGGGMWVCGFRVSCSSLMHVLPWLCCLRARAFGVGTGDGAVSS